MSKLIILPAVIALHLLCVVRPCLGAERPVVMPPLVVPACKQHVLVQGSGSVRVCKGGAFWAGGDK